MSVFHHQYAILLGLVFLLQIASGVVAVLFREEFTEGLEEEMARQAYEEVDTDPDHPITAAWNAMQVTVRSRQKSLQKST